MDSFAYREMHMACYCPPLETLSWREITGNVPDTPTNKVDKIHRVISEYLSAQDQQNKQVKLTKQTKQVKRTQQDKSDKQVNHVVSEVLAAQDKLDELDEQSEEEGQKKPAKQLRQITTELVTAQAQREKDEQDGPVTSELLSAKELLKRKDTGFAGADIAVIYAQGDLIRRCRSCRAAFEEKFQVPRTWWTTLAKRSNGYFGYQDVLDSDGKRTGTVSWLRFMIKRVSKVLDAHNDDQIQYSWVKLNVFTRWYAADQRMEVILFDHPKFAHLVGASLLRDINPRELGDPFWVYPSMVDEMVQLHDVTIWETRNLLRDFEKRRAFYKFQYSYLHEIPRHLIHVNETVYVTESVLTSIQKHHNHFLSTNKVNNTTSRDEPNLFFLNIQNRLDSLHSMLTNLRHRAESNNARIQNEMALTYNDAARIDTSAMRAISLIGLLFLPAAFVAAIFSTSFFNFDAPTGIWRISQHFWIYWAVTVPLTAATVVTWFFGPAILDRVLPEWRRWIE